MLIPNPIWAFPIGGHVMQGYEATWHDVRKVTLEVCENILVLMRAVYEQKMNRL
jgi:hypothetical protein